MRITTTGIDVTGTVTADGLTVDGTGSVTQSSNAATALMTFTNANAGASARSAISLASDIGSSVVGTVSSGWTVDALSANETFLYGSNGVSLFAPASQDVRILAGGSEKLVVKSSGNVGIGIAPQSFTKLMVKTATDRNVSIFDNATGATVSGLTDAGASTALRLAGFPLIFTGNGGSGSEAMRIDSSGAVIVNNSGGDAQIYLGGSGGTSRMYLARSGTDALLWNVDGGVMKFGTNNTERMRIDSSGNVGIGTSSPNSLFHIYESGSGDATLEIDNTQSGTSTIVGKQGSSAYGATAAGNAAFYTYDNDISIMADGGAGNTSSIKFSTGGNTERMRIDSGGSVLIGKSTPTDLHNTWNHLIIGEKGAIISENGAGGIDGITLADNVYIDADTGNYAYQTTAAASQITQSGGVIAFSNAGSGSAGAALTPVERMRINSSGNVLIRQTSDAVFDTNASSTVASFYGLQVSSANSTSTKTILGNNSDGNYIGSATTNSAGKEIINGYVRIASTVQTAGLEEGVILFSTKPSGSAAATERMRIDASGNLLVGTTTTPSLTGLAVGSTTTGKNISVF
ncbi:MAG: hypothetical protein ACO23H_19485, partial [Alphaproteobacteria bacterium]